MDDKIPLRPDGNPVEAKYIKLANEFRYVFGGYFPHLADLEAALNEWNWLHSRWTLNSIETVRRSQEMKTLEQAIQAVRALTKGSCWWPWWGTLYAAKTAAEADDADRVTQDLGYIAAALKELGNINLPNEEGATLRLEKALARFREEAIAEMGLLPDTGNTNWDAVFAVDSLRIVWWRNTDCEAPRKALNPASEFASFLGDGLRYLKVEASTVPAFRRWAAWSSSTDRH